MIGSIISVEGKCHVQLDFACVNPFSSVGERQMASAASPNQIVLFPFQSSPAVVRSGRKFNVLRVSFSCVTLLCVCFARLVPLMILNGRGLITAPYWGTPFLKSLKADK